MAQKIVKPKNESEKKYQTIKDGQLKQVKIL